MYRRRLSSKDVPTEFCVTVMLLLLDPGLELDTGEVSRLWIPRKSLGSPSPLAKAKDPS